MTKTRNKRIEIRIPRFGETDLNFLIAREFPRKVEKLKKISSELEDQGLDLERVMAAILKLAKGNFRELKRLVKIAQMDQRDVIAYAETPRRMALDYQQLSTMTEEQKEQLRIEDWQEYEDWRNGSN